MYYVIYNPSLFPLDHFVLPSFGTKIYPRKWDQRLKYFTNDGVEVESFCYNSTQAKLFIEDAEFQCDNYIYMELPPLTMSLVEVKYYEDYSQDDNVKISTIDFTSKELNLQDERCHPNVKIE